MKKPFIYVLIFILLLTTNTYASEVSYCSEPGRWAERMTYSTLKNSNIINPQDIDFDKTTVKLIAEQKTDKDLYKQVHLITYTTKSGKKIEVISINDASSEECSIGHVDVYHIKNSYINLPI